MYVCSCVFVRVRDFCCTDGGLTIPEWKLLSLHK